MNDSVRSILKAQQPAQEPVKQDNRLPNNDHVICPACVHEFRAIPVNVQKMMIDAGFEPPFMEPVKQEPVAWISVEDRLPEVKAEGMGFFLVTVINLQTQKRLVFEAAFLNEMELYSDDHGPEPFSGWHSAKESKDYDGWYEPIGNECCKVTHWMPLPPPPATQGEA